MLPRHGLYSTYEGILGVNRIRSAREPHEKAREKAANVIILGLTPWPRLPMDPQGGAQDDHRRPQSGAICVLASGRGQPALPPEDPRQNGTTIPENPV